MIFGGPFVAFDATFVNTNPSGSICSSGIFVNTSPIMKNNENIPSHLPYKREREAGREETRPWLITRLALSLPLSFALPCLVAKPTSCTPSTPKSQQSTNPTTSFTFPITEYYKDPEQKILRNLNPQILISSLELQYAPI